MLIPLFTEPGAGDRAGSPFGETDLLWSGTLDAERTDAKSLNNWVANWVGVVFGGVLGLSETARLTGVVDGSDGGAICPEGR